ncbi:DUF2561 family protein [Mycobacterium sp. IDR2000157661]|uniref:DUF2561 family protein n=1 Tax=Mycobacterium sp. IDR2000157661 TaxID=2867005 RepID=UPI001EEB281C|nr:DUF2561 family protein [Mycobacterium sp. IDR2000157661]ULE32097.1 DUF2561 family protein [Mycobacterium sp. IDR2000157661]
MAYDTDASGRARLTPMLDHNGLDRTDRILLGSCAAIWLIALGAGVAATVALVDLGQGRTEPSGEAGTPWLLYAVIGISAVVIAGAVPLLLRARREAMAAEAGPSGTQPAARPASGRTQDPAAEPATTEKIGVPAARSGQGASYAAPRALRTPEDPEPTSAAADQVSLRCALAIACAIGIAMVAIGVGTYLMAVDSTVVAWVCYALAALVTLAMPAVPWFYLKELRAQLDQPAA